MIQELSQQLTEKLLPAQTTSQRHLETLLHISRAIGSTLNTHDLMRQIMQQVTGAFVADRSTLFLHDPQRRQLWSRVAQGLDETSRVLRIPDNQGLAGNVFQSQESMLVPDTFQNKHFARRVAEQTGYVPRSMLIVPLAHRPGRCDGVLQVMDHQVNRFSSSDLQLLEAIAVQVGVSLDNARLYEAQKRQFDSFVRAFSAALDARDPCTQLHSINVANFAVGIGSVLALPRKQLEWLRVAGLLHDVGKIGTPESILTKPGKLTDDEFEEMKRHAAHSRKILCEIEFIDDFQDMATLAAAHHERIDGTGYPDGLQAEQLPLNARILAVADVMDALTQDRHYRPSMSLQKALAIIDRMTPHQLDQRCVDALKQFIGVR